jgi:phosphate acyltransferase
VVKKWLKPRTTNKRCVDARCRRRGANAPLHFSLFEVEPVIRLAVDCMGGDIGPKAVVPAVLSVLERHHDLSAQLVGDQTQIEPLVQLAALAPQVAARVSFVHTNVAISMTDTPAFGLRFKRDSSIHLALAGLKRHEVDAVISAGNTGALMAVARFVLRTIPGIDRPAMCTDMPRPGGCTTVLDLGANVDCTAEHLLQFGLMGSAFAAAVHAIESPKVGLLNIGSEDMKGNEVVKQAAVLLAASSLNFVGNVEGNGIYKRNGEGGADVVVCDGFVGNVALKTSEGLASMLSQYIREEFSNGPFSRFAGLVSLRVLNRLKHRVDHRRYNGACLLGLRGVVFKSHGSADAYAFEQAILRAVAAVRNDMLGTITRALTPQASLSQPTAEVSET